LYSGAGWSNVHRKEVSVLQDLRQAAIGFAECFPHVTFEDRPFENALQAASVSGGRAQRLGALATHLLREPPVDDLLLPFVHTILVQAAVMTGANRDEAEELASRIVNRVTEPIPLFGLKVAIGGPRSGMDVELLRRHDLVIENLHIELREVGAFPFGPQEHGPDMEHAPASQWHGHINADCDPRVDHDALIVLFGRSVGLGESLEIARHLLIPGLGVELIPQAAVAGKGLARPVRSCRLGADGVVIQNTLQGVEDEDVPLAVVGELVRLAPLIRARQRQRHRSIAKLHRYRRYVESSRALGEAHQSLAKLVREPLRFAALSEVQQEELARTLGVLTRDEHEVWTQLAVPIRKAFDEFVREEKLPAYERGALLHRASREMMLTAVDGRVQRPRNWADLATWNRLRRERRGSW
jgi:hypothetical protein